MTQIRLGDALQRCALLAIASSGLASAVGATPLTAIVSDPSHVRLRLEPVVTLGGFVPIDAATVPGDDNLYVGTYIAATASVQVVHPATGTIAAAPFLTFAGTGVPITGQGLQGITFSPNFHDNSRPGYRKFYTYQQESGPGGANVMFRHPEVSNPGSVAVLREWTANSEGTAIDTSIPSRIVLNFGTPAGHMGGGMKFGPDGYLYLATGDGGGNGDGGSTSNNSDGFTGRNPSGTSNDVPGISNGQDFTNMLGKLIRIDPYVTNADGSPRAAPESSTAKEFGGATRYFIPDDNPFVGNPQNIYFTPIGPATEQSPVAPLEELFAFGFRNPWKLSFDKQATVGDLPFVADVGSRKREEISLVGPGENHGWPYREGEIASGAANGRPLVDGHLPFLKQTGPGVFEPYDLNPALSDPAQTALPLAQLGTRSGSNSSNLMFADRPGNDIDADDIYGNQYGDASSVTGGFVYRGSAIPALAGMYVFGAYQYLIDDPTRDPATYPATSGGGRLLYFDPAEAIEFKTIREFNFAEGFGINTGRIPGSFSSFGDLLGMAEGDDGELYAMFANGDIKLLAAATTVLPGDYNDDGVVNAGDYVVWRNNEGTSNVLMNDPLGGAIGAAQYNQWVTSYGNVAGEASRAGAVPEPSTAFALWTWAWLGLAARCRARELR